MKNINIRFVTFLFCMSLLVPAVSSAQNLTIEEILASIESLQKKIIELQTELAALQSQKNEAIQELVRTMKIGARGEDVKTLQALLAADSDLYPEALITGYFGPLTSKAIRKFQALNGIEQVGFIGPKTLKKLNEYFKKSMVVIVDNNLNNTTSTSTNPSLNNYFALGSCVVVPPGHLIAPGYLKKIGDRDDDEDDDEDNDEDDDEDNDEDDDEDDDEDRGNKKDKKEKKNKKIKKQPFSIPCHLLPPGIAKKIGHGTTTPPTADTTPPVISNIGVSSITQTIASVAWNTNELSKSKMSYGTSTTYTNEVGFGSTYMTSFSQLLSGLTASTTYHFQITAKDQAGNSATSTDMMFTTASIQPPADTTPPLMIGVSVGNIASTTAEVAWTTNEFATSKVYYGTSTPLVLATASFIADSLLVTNHLKSLSGLTASTTHYFVVESKDAVNNTATSTESSFTTHP